VIAKMIFQQPSQSSVSHNLKSYSYADLVLKKLFFYYYQCWKHLFI